MSTLSQRIADEIMRQYEANRDWEEAKDVIEGLDCDAIAALLDAASRGIEGDDVAASPQADPGERRK